MVDLITEAERIISQFNQEEKEIYENLREMLLSEAKLELIGRYKIAKYVHDIYTRAKEKSSLYGQSLISRLAIAIGYKSVNPLYEMIKVVDTWKTEEEFKLNVIDTLGQDEDKVTWKEVVFISRRDEAEQKVIIDKLQKGKDLEEVKKELDYKPTKPGKSVKKVDSINDFTNQINKVCNDILSRKEDSWDDFDLLGEVTAVLEYETESVIETVLNKLDQTLENLKTLRTELYGMIVEMEKIRERIEKRLTQKDDKTEDDSEDRGIGDDEEDYEEEDDYSTEAEQDE